MECEESRFNATTVVHIWAMSLAMVLIQQEKDIVSTLCRLNLKEGSLLRRRCITTTISLAKRSKRRS
jgi:hypothetical protein